LLLSSTNKDEFHTFDAHDEIPTASIILQKNVFNFLRDSSPKI